MSFSGKFALICMVLAGILSGCSDKPNPEAGQAAQDEQAAEVDHVWKEQVEALDRAKEVEQTIKDADEAKRKAIKDAGGG